MSTRTCRRNVVVKLLMMLVRAPARGRMLVMIVMLAGLMAMDTWLMVKLANYGGQIIDALTARDATDFYSLVARLFTAAMIGAACFVIFTYLHKRLLMEARTALTHPWLGLWLDDEALYRIEREQQLDNPDQRIAEDLKLFLEKSIDLGVETYSAMLGIGAFSALLWQQGGSFDFTWGGREVSIPGYLFWAALLFAIVNTWITQWIARPLIGLNMNQQRVEADFRFGMIQVREHAEQVALYRGADVEYDRLTGRFEQVRQNWWRLIFYQMRWACFSFTTSSFATYATYLMLAPKVLGGAMTVGAMTTLHTAFGAVFGKLNWAANAWQKIVEWIAVVNRLRDMDAALDAPPLPGGVHVAETDTPVLASRNLALALPDGEVLATIGDLRMTPGERWLVRGPSGVGKSTLLRAIAGLWPYGHGHIERPARGVLFLPQKSYLPWDTLKVALAYPQPPEAYRDEACRQALIDCRLPHLVDRLHERDRWGMRLSLGEQQRVAFARALLGKPEFLFLDESTSALDLDTEAHLYQLLVDRLPGTALISVAHRTTLDRFHDHRLLVLPEGPAMQTALLAGTSG